MNKHHAHTLLIDTEWFELADLADKIRALLDGAPESDRDAGDVLDDLAERAPLLIAERLIDAETIGACLQLAWAQGWDLDPLTTVINDVNAYDVIATCVRRGVPLRVSAATAVDLAADATVDAGALEYLEDPDYRDPWGDQDGLIAFHVALATRGGAHRASARTWFEDHDVDLRDWDSPRYALSGVL